MSGGMKEMQINTQERAVSVDINRLQKFKNADIMELFRYMMNVQSNDDLDGAAILTEFNTLDAPMKAEIINGLLVRPQAGNFNLLVDPGVILCMAPDAAPDDSNYKYVHDAGVLVAGNLVVTANGAGSIRYDIVEVQNGNVIVEQDNRDIFNPVTGLFSASTVTKARANTVTQMGIPPATNIRVRAGTAGAGIPALLTGWLPICVILHPAGSVSNDNCAFWDVRPLIGDRAIPPFNLTMARPYVDKCDIDAQVTTAATGTISARFGSGTTTARRIGGRLRSGSPFVADADTFDLTAATSQENGFPLTASKPYFLYLAFPAGLPRWVRYTTSNPRVPRGPRGIPVVSQNNAPDVFGASNVVLPTVFGTIVASGFCVASGWVSGVPLIGRMVVSDRRSLSSLEAPAIVGTSGGSGTNFYQATFSMTPGVHYPGHAREILVQAVATTTVSVVGSVSSAFRIFDPTGATVIQSVAIPSTTSTTTATLGLPNTGAVWIQLPAAGEAAAIATQKIQFTYLMAGGTTITETSAPVFSVVGWKI